jgi:hypothetical protein
VTQAPATSGKAGPLPLPPRGPLPPGEGRFTLKKAIRAAEKRLSNLGLAIAELFVLAGLSAVGTVIEQDQVWNLYAGAVLCSVTPHLPLALQPDTYGSLLLHNTTRQSIGWAQQLPCTGSHGFCPEFPGAKPL